MTKITNINRQTGRVIVSGAMEKLAAFAEELGLSVEQEGRWTYDHSGDWMTLKVKFVAGGDEGREELAKRDFALACWRYGLKESDYGATFTSGGKTYRIIGINTRSRRYPIECEEVGTGKKIRYTDMAATLVAAQRK